jgi:hypothetical protein
MKKKTEIEEAGETRLPEKVLLGQDDWYDMWQSGGLDESWEPQSEP